MTTLLRSLPAFCVALRPQTYELMAFPYETMTIPRISTARPANSQRLLAALVPFHSPVKNPRPLPMRSDP